VPPHNARRGVVMHTEELGKEGENDTGHIFLRNMSIADKTLSIQCILDVFNSPIGATDTLHWSAGTTRYNIYVSHT